MRRKPDSNFSIIKLNLNSMHRKYINFAVLLLCDDFFQHIIRGGAILFAVRVVLGYTINGYKSTVMYKAALSAIFGKAV